MSSSDDTGDDSGSDDLSSTGETAGAAGLMARFDAFMAKDARQTDVIMTSFYAMQRRRLQRAQDGYRLKVGSTISGFLQWNMIVLVFTVATEFFMDYVGWDSQRHAQYFWFHAVPVVVSAVIILHVSSLVLSHFATYKTLNICIWGVITFVCWTVWYRKFPTRLQHATAALATYFAVVGGLALGKRFCYTRLLPFLVGNHVGAHCFWRVRRQRNCFGHRYTYLAKGFFGCRRYVFSYEGDTDSQKRPHGVGTWRDCTISGETLYGVWEHGKPLGAFISWETATNAQTMQLPVGYVTCRGDCPTTRLDSNSYFPVTASRLRHGVAHVEVSYAGGFMPFLPALGGVKSWIDFHSMVDALLEAVNLREKILGLSGHGTVPSLLVEVVDSPADLPRHHATLEANVTIRAAPGGHVGYVERSKLGPISGLVEAKREVCVFIHGFGVDLATAMERMAQIYALGGMPVHVVPLVFSWSSADPVSGLFAVKDALRLMPSHGRHLRRLFEGLAEYFEDVHVLTHSMGARVFYMNFEEVKSCFRPRQLAAGPGLADDSSGGAGGTRRGLRLRNLVTLNPAVMVERVSKVLPEIMKYAERYTTYNDRYDVVVELDRLGQRVFSSGGAEAQREFEAIPFGRVIRPVWLERDLSGNCSVRGLPKREDSLDTRQRYKLRRGLTKFMVRWFGRSGRSGRSDRSKEQDATTDTESGSDTPRQADCDESRIDVIDCTNMDTNASATRHNYYGANAVIARDVCCLIGERKVAARRPGLARKGTKGNVYDFSIAPSGYML